MRAAGPQRAAAPEPPSGPAASRLEQQARWRRLVDGLLPEAARDRPEWPVRLDHGFARILLDNACGGPWRESVAPPAWVNMPAGRLSSAIELGEAVLAGRADLALLNRRSLQWRGRLTPPPAPDALRDGDLVLRRWRRADDLAFSALNADPAVMRHFPAPKGRAESLMEARALDRRFEADGFGPWAVEEAGRFLGFAGAMRLMRAMPFAGGERPGECVEVGWRFASAGWGRGLATRAARLGLADLFGRCGILSVVAFTAAENAASRRVMERLGMGHAPTDDFDHPGVPEESGLRRHVLYRLAASDWQAAETGPIA